MTEPVGDSWYEVRRLRREAEDYARRGDMLAASTLDALATGMARRLATGVEWITRTKD
jgi:hypothetical protein